MVQKGRSSSADGAPGLAKGSVAAGAAAAGAAAGAVGAAATGSFAVKEPYQYDKRTGRKNV